MYIQISEARLVPDGYGNRIEITKVWLYDSDWVRTKRLKLNDVVVNELKYWKIEIVAGLFPHPILDETTPTDTGTSKS